MIEIQFTKMTQYPKNNFNLEINEKLAAALLLILNEADLQEFSDETMEIIAKLEKDLIKFLGFSV